MKNFLRSRKIYLPITAPDIAPAIAGVFPTKLEKKSPQKVSRVGALEIEVPGIWI